MKKYISIALCAFSLTLAGCASAPNSPTEGGSSSEGTGSSIPSHEHTYSDSWSNDDTYHWHSATCEHKDLVKDKTTHTFGSWTIDKQATEYETGSRHRICTVCEYRVDDTIAKLDHTHKAGDPVKENEVAPTCEGYGSYDTVVYCTECNAEISRVNETISPLGHDYGEWAVKTPAKCQEDGTEERVCSRDPSHKETRKIEAIGHKWGEVTYEWSDDYSNCTAKRVCENDPSHIDSEKVASTSAVTKQPTYSEEGLIKYSAVFKNEAFAKQEYNLVTEKRSMLSYKLSTDGTYYTVKMDSSSIFGDIVVPSTYNNLPVKEVDYLGFYGCTKITSVALPSSIVKIGYSAFETCSSLTSVTLNEGLTEIGYEAFMSCDKLEAIEIPSTVAKIGYNAFYRCTGLKEATLKDGLVEIGSCAFYNCSSLASIHIPDTVTSLGTSALKECSALKEVYIGRKVASLESGALYNCNALESLTLPYIGKSVSEDGCLADYFTISTTSQSYLYNYTPSTLKSVTILDTCVSLSNHAFDGCTNIESLTLPFIGGSADENQFLGYIYGGSSEDDNATKVPTSLKKITISEACTSVGDKAFVSCASLEEVSIGENIVSIGYRAFRDCDGIASLTIPAKVKTISDSAFTEMDSLVALNFLGNEFKLGLSVFAESVNLQSIKVPDSNLNYSVSDSILYNKDKTRIICCPAALSGKIVIPDTVTSIEEYAFYGCAKITEIALPDSLTEIERNTFCRCTSLESINIPNGVASIGKAAFASCSALESIVLPNTLEAIGDYAFSYCTSLLSATILNGVKTLGIGAFLKCTALSSVSLPDSVTSIGDGAFEDCTSLTSFKMPQKVTNISAELFFGCTSLTSVELSVYDVGTIGEKAFAKCSSLAEITLPYVSSVGDYAFFGCTSLAGVGFSDNLSSIGNYAFYNCSALQLIVYDGTTSAWSNVTKGTSWKYGVTLTKVVQCSNGNASL